MKLLVFLFVSVGVLCGTPVVALSGTSTTLSHQGVIAVRSERFTGPGAFRFALVEPDTQSYLWINDGSVVTHPAPPAQAVVLPVVNGVYNVQLGDVSVQNMTALPEDVFSANQNIVVRVWFDDQHGGGVHVMNPDIPVTTAPLSQYAYVSAQLNVPGTSVPAVIVDGDGNVTVPGGLSVDTDTLVVDQSTGRVGIGVPAPDFKLDVAGAIRTDDLETTGVVSGPAFAGWDRDETDDLSITTTFTGDVGGTFDAMQIPWTGVVVPFAGPADRIPDGWLLCDGRAVSSAAYPELFGVIGTAWGTGMETPADDPDTDFNLPDLRGKFPRGVSAASTDDPEADQRLAIAAGGNTGNNVGTLQDSSTARPAASFTTDVESAHTHGINSAGSHSHTFSATTDDSGDNGPPSRGGTGGTTSNRSTSSTGSHGHSMQSAGQHSHVVSGGGDAETRPINVAVNYIIKY